jgi:putative DNA primase/helicase
MTNYNPNDIRTMEAAKGRWQQILTAAGIGAEVLNGQQQPCPLCREGHDRFQYDNKYGDGNYICRKCGAGTGFTLLAKWRGLDRTRDFKKLADWIDNLLGQDIANAPTRMAPPSAEKIARQKREAEQEKRKVELVKNIWGASRPIEAGDVVDRYLAGRSIGIKAATGLRHHPNCYHWISKTWHPAMVALFKRPTQWSCATDPHDNAQITFLTSEGLKAEVTPQRLNIAGTMPDGGAIRLQPAAAVMGVAEGVESALSAAELFGMPVWATTSKAMLNKWRVPEIVTHLVIYADNDQHDQGIMAAESLARRVLFEAERNEIARTVEIKCPPNVGEDWNDVLKQDKQHA